MKYGRLAMAALALGLLSAYFTPAFASTVRPKPRPAIAFDACFSEGGVIYVMPKAGASTALAVSQCRAIINGER